MNNNIKVIAILFFVLILLVSCNESSEKKMITQQKKLSVSVNELPSAEKTISDMKELKIKREMWESALTEQKLLYATIPNEKEENSGIYQYDISTSKETLLKQLDYSYTHSYGTSTIDEEGNWSYYSATNRNDGKNMSVVMDSYNYKKNQFKTLSKIESEIPFADIHALSNNQLAVWTPKITPDGKVNRFSVDYFGVKGSDLSKQNIIQTAFDREKLCGISISGIGIYNDIIHVMCEENGKLYFLLYDKDGKQIEKRDSTFIKAFQDKKGENIEVNKEKLFTESSIWSFKVFQNYYWFQDMSDSYALAKYENGKMNVLYLQSGSTLQGSEYTKDTVANQYIYFSNASQKTIVVFDKKTENVHQIKINPGYEYTNIYFVVTDDRDNAVLSIVDSNSNSRLFYLTAEQVKAQLKQQ